MEPESCKHDARSHRQQAEQKAQHNIQDCSNPMSILGELRRVVHEGRERRVGSDKSHPNGDAGYIGNLNGSAASV